MVTAGQSANFSVVAEGTAPLLYQWQKNGTAIIGETSPSYTTPPTTTADNGAHFAVTISDKAGSVTSNPATLTVTASDIAPSLSSQPVGQTIAAGQTATFSVTASGTAPLSYQWNKNGTAISGATSSTYTTPSETTADNGAQFIVMVSNAAGSIASNAATLNVNAAAAPSITSQPVGQTITAGQTATFSVTASGTAPLNYQWNKNGTAISGATSSTYTTPPENPTDNGAQFTVVVSNATGSVTSGAATLTVNAAAVPPSITSQPVGQTIAVGQTAKFSVTASGTVPLGYQWNKNGTAISGATSSTYTTPATSPSDNGAQFTVVVTNSVGNVSSNAATLTVTTAPVAPSITTQPLSRTITAGQTATFSVRASGTAPLNYQWNKNGTAISGAISSSYTTPAETPSDNGAQFTVVVTNSVGNVSSNAATLTVNAATFLLSAAPTSLSFGNVNTSASSTLAVILTNSGNSDVTISNVSVSGPGFNASGVPAGQILTPSQSATLNVLFAPTAAGSVTGSVTVVSNATNSPVMITLAGTGQSTAPPGLWITGTYSAQNARQPVSAIPWNKYTHMLHFAAAPGVDGNGNGNGTVEMHYLTQTEINQIVAAAHAAGKKIMVTIKDNDSYLNAFGQSTAPGLIATFVSNIASFVNTNGYDGADFDWEANISVTQYEDLLSRMRATFGSTKLITAYMGNWNSMDIIAGASYANIDQINMMCYDMDNPGNGFSWYNDALTNAGNTSVSACDWRIQPFITAGVPASKIGVGIPFYGRRWPGVTQALVTGSFNPSTVLYSDLVTDGTRWQPQYQFYDTIYKSDYLSIPPLNEFDSYNGVQSIKDVVAWQKSRGFGGFMTFTVDYEYLSTQTGDARYPLSTTLCQDVFGTCP